MSQISIHAPSFHWEATMISKAALLRAIAGLAIGVVIGYGAYSALREPTLEDKVAFSHTTIAESLFCLRDNSADSFKPFTAYIDRDGASAGCVILSPGTPVIATFESPYSAMPAKLVKGNSVVQGTLMGVGYIQPELLPLKQ
jgi:hypothetical protein